MPKSALFHWMLRRPSRLESATFVFGLLTPFLMTQFLQSVIAAGSLIASNVESADLATLPPVTQIFFRKYVTVALNDLVTDRVDPYLDALSLDFVYQLVFLSGSAVLLLLVAVRLFGRAFRYQVIVSRTMGFILVSALAGFLITRAIPANGWDETFLMTSQIDSVISGHGNRVWLTGPVAYSESSTDVGPIWIAALMKLVFQGDAIQALVLVNSIGFGLIWLYCSVRLRRSIMQSKSFHIIFALVLIFSPQLVGAASAGFPTVWQTLALIVLFSENVSEAPWSRPGRHTAAMLFAVFVRPENILVCVAITIAILGRLARSSLFGEKISNSSLNRFAMVKGLFLPYVCMSGLGLIKLLLYQQLIPVAITGKAVGLDGSYLFSGISYLERTFTEGGVGVYLSALLILVLVGGERMVSTMVLLVVSVVPGIMIGGDLFPAYWARYVFPALLALVFSLVIKLLIKSPEPDEEFALRRYRPKPLCGGLLVALLVINLATAGSKSPWIDLKKDATDGRRADDYNSEIVNPDNWNVRPVCLARTGLILGQILPQKVGIATTELNTLSYFANQPLTDLFGLADSRTGSSPFDPLEAGEWGYKRRNPKIIDDDRPGVLYQSDVLSCRVGSSTYGDWRTETVKELSAGNTSLAIGELRTIVDGTSFRYRFGDPSRIAQNYTPVNISTDAGTSVLVFIRNDLVPAVLTQVERIGGRVREFAL